jgi:hypothetical protein
MDIEHLDQDVMLGLFSHDESWYLLKTELGSTSKPTLPINKDKESILLENGDGDENTFLINRVSEPIELFLRKDQTRVPGIRLYSRSIKPD